MDNAPRTGEADEAVAASKRPWKKPSIRTLRITTTQSGVFAGRDEDDISNPAHRGQYLPVS